MYFLFNSKLNGQKLGFNTPLIFHSYGSVLLRLNQMFYCALRPSYPLPTQKLFCLYVFRQAGPPQWVLGRLLGPKMGNNLKCLSSKQWHTIALKVEPWFCNLLIQDYRIFRTIRRTLIFWKIECAPFTSVHLMYGSGLWPSFEQILCCK